MWNDAEFPSNESRRYFEARYDNVQWSSYPRTDRRSRENEVGELLVPLSIEQDALSAAKKNYGISRNEFFIAVAALAIGIYNKKPDVLIAWNYNGREDAQLISSVGLLFRELPVGIRFRDHLKLRDVFEDVHDQVQKGIEHCCYPYVDIHGQVVTGETAYVLYQQDIRDKHGMEGVDAEILDVRQNQAASQTILDIEILDGQDGLMLRITFAASWYRELSIQIFKDIYVAIAHLMVNHSDIADISIGDIKARLQDRSHLLRGLKGIKGIISRKK